MTRIPLCLCPVSALLLSYALAAGQSSSMRHDEMKHGQIQQGKAPEEVCRGFVVLKDGYAVMSGMSEKGGGHGHHSHGEPKMGQQIEGSTPMPRSGSVMEGMKHETGKRDHLMGLKHGDAHPVSVGVLCVPMDESVDSWHAVSNAKDLQVTVSSLKGPLQHNSRENEAFELLVMRGDDPIEDAEVLLIARMPQHDRSVKGGHGPANDPDVKGIEASPSSQGRYTVRTVDFSMGGSWLFEIDVKQGDEVARAYFATPIGEE